MLLKMWYSFGMNKIIIIISAVVVDVLFLFASRAYQPSLSLQPSSVGFTSHLWVIPVYFILIPILLGVISFVRSRENRLKQALVSFGISLLVAIVIVIPFVLNEGEQDSTRTTQKNDQARTGYVGTINTALFLYFNANNQYPSNLDQLVQQGFIDKIRVDPLNNEPFFYLVSDDRSFYNIGTNLEEKNEIYLSGDSDCNSSTSRCPRQIINTEIFDGGDDDGCNNEIGRYCYDLAPRF
jgi:NADH:ubiquinone oxidoreductase subunit 6 (subunit J)